MKARIHESTWAQIRMGYASGIGLRELARNMGIPAGTVLSRAMREGWTQQIADAKALAATQSNAITATQGAAMSLRERAERHVQSMAGVVERTMPRVEEMDAGEVLDHVEKVDRFDRLARRQYGLDEQAGHGAATLNINFLSNPVIEYHGTVIEAETSETEP